MELKKLNKPYQGAVQKVMTARTPVLLLTFPSTFLPPHPSSPDLASSDFHFFTHLEQFLAGWRMSNSADEKTFKDWFSELAADFYDADINKLVTPFNLCLDNHWNNLECDLRVTSNFLTFLTPWPESGSELYQLSVRLLSAKLVPTFPADTVCRVVSSADPCCLILGFLDRSCYYCFHVAPQLYSRG
jgi:hypothetical protein